MARFSPEDRGRRSGTCAKQECRSSASPSIWAGRTPRCESSSPMPAASARRHASALSCGCRLEEREEISRGLAAGDSIRAIAEALGRSPSTVCREVNANGGRREVPGPGGRPGGVPAGAATQAGQAGAVPPAPRGRRAQARGQVVTPADLGVVGSGVPRSPGDAGVPRDHLPVTLRPEPWSAAQRAPFVPAQLVGPCAGPRPTPRATSARASSRTW